MKLFLPRQGVRNVVRALYSLKNLASDQCLTVRLTSYLILNQLVLKVVELHVRPRDNCENWSMWTSEASFANLCA